MDSGQLQERLDGAVSDALHVEIEPGIFGSGAAIVLRVVLTLFVQPWLTKVLQPTV